VPWKVTRIVDARMELVVRHRAGERVIDLCREYGISRKTAHKFLQRYERLGPSGLVDESRAPHRQARRTVPEVEAQIVECKKEHPSWGAKKLKDVLERKHPGVSFPSRGTFEAILRRHDLVVPRARKPRVRPRLGPLTVPSEPNQVWAVDYKGDFRLGNGRRCYPLTSSDLCTRFVLGCEALESTEYAPAREAFERLFETFGLPEVIRTDNGTPFVSTRSLLGLTRLSVHWLSLGIRHERIDPGHPEQNGVHERMHRTLKQETTRPAAANGLQQQERFDRFLETFNTERPHESLGMKRPADLYTPSAKRYDPKPLDYPMHDDVVVVGRYGQLCRGRRCKSFLSAALAGYPVGLREVDDDVFLVSFASIDLGLLHARTSRFAPFDPLADPSSSVGNLSPM